MRRQANWVESLGCEKDNILLSNNIIMTFLQKKELFDVILKFLTINADKLAIININVAPCVPQCSEAGSQGNDLFPRYFRLKNVDNPIA